MAKRHKHKLNPTLRFSPYAWAKLLAFRDYGPTEIAGFGVSAGSDPLLIDDFVTVKQRGTSVTVAMDDEAVADYFDQQVDQGHQPEQFLRVWLHTHPGESAQPSGTDEETFERVFGQCDWAVMAILARGGQSYARLRFGVGPGGQMLIPVEVDFSVAFPAADHEAWQAEYNLHVTAESEFRVMHPIPGTLLNADGEEDLAQLHHRRLHRWHEQDSWDMQELNELADELQRQAILEDMEVELDSR